MKNPPALTQVFIPVADAALHGDLALPDSPHGIVIFAHGSGSSRLSTRNRFVAAALNRAGLATLLFDLLTQEEEIEERFTRHLRFNIPLLASRLAAATDFLAQSAPLSELPTGYFGASTGAAAALTAAADRPDRIRTVVSRGGRPDLAGDALPRVRAPTLLIVGGEDHEVITLNARALALLTCPKRMEIIPGATHLFEEPGALEKVAQIAADWFARHLSRAFSHLSHAPH